MKLLFLIIFFLIQGCTFVTNVGVNGFLKKIEKIEYDCSLECESIDNPPNDWCNCMDSCLSFEKVKIRFDWKYKTEICFKDSSSSQSNLSF